MNLPLNGRIAIIDNEVDQVFPLMRVFAKNSLPYVFYKGDDLAFLPDEGSANNDVRILFLDINLLNERTPSEREIRASLVSVIKRVISTNNFPYSLIYWSRQEHEFSPLVEDIFNSDLSDRRPINIMPFVKSDFFPNFSAVEHQTETDIISRLQEIIAGQKAYSYLLSWENYTHNATDSTLQQVFSSYHDFKDWSNNANYIINKLGSAYLGKHFDNFTPTKKIQGSFISLNTVFRDTLEHFVYNSEIENPEILEVDQTNLSNNDIEINRKLNFSNQIVEISEPGTVIVFEDEGFFYKLLNKLISFFELKKKIKGEKNEISELELKNQASKEHKRIKDEIKKTCFKVAVVVTPVCDFVQKDNKIFDRVVNGLLIPAKYKNYIEAKSEAIFIFPFTIQQGDEIFVLVIDFRYFTTLDLSTENVQPLFRVRQELLSEIQSKLARHITRQGILFLDERV